MVLVRTTRNRKHIPGSCHSDDQGKCVGLSPVPVKALPTHFSNRDFEGKS